MQYLIGLNLQKPWIYPKPSSANTRKLFNQALHIKSSKRQTSFIVLNQSIQNPCNMHCLATCPIGNLMTATGAIGDHPGIGVLANGG